MNNSQKKRQVNTSSSATLWQRQRGPGKWRSQSLSRMPHRTPAAKFDRKWKTNLTPLDDDKCHTCLSFCRVHCCAIIRVDDGPWSVRDNSLLTRRLLCTGTLSRTILICYQLLRLCRVTGNGTTGLRNTLFNLPPVSHSMTLIMNRSSKIGVKSLVCCALQFNKYTEAEGNLGPLNYFPHRYYIPRMRDKSVKWPFACASNPSTK